MGHEFSGLMKRPWTTTPWKSFFVIHGIFNAIKRPWKATQNFHGVFMSISWIYPGLRVFMAHENWKINGFFMAFLMFFFFMLFPGWRAMKNLVRFPMKIPLKSFENPVNLQWINSQDFHGFLVRLLNITTQVLRSDSNVIMCYYYGQCWNCVYLVSINLHSQRPSTNSTFVSFRSGHVAINV